MQPATGLLLAAEQQNRICVCMHVSGSLHTSEPNTIELPVAVAPVS